MVSDTKSSRPVAEEREAAFARLASRVIETLNGAVEYRRSEGVTLTEIAARIGCHKSSISRALNGNCPNLTLRTVSDILWASDFDPEDFRADPVEKLCPNWVPPSQFDTVDGVISYPTKSISMPENMQYFSALIRRQDSDLGVIAA